MGRSYWFECARCGYRTKVSGGADRGVDFFVQTILCRDCKQLYDAVTRIRWPENSPASLGQLMNGWRPAKLQNHALHVPPTFQNASTRLYVPGPATVRWINFPLQCPVSPRHRIQSWNDPDKCPRCGLQLEKNALPHRIWD